MAIFSCERKESTQLDKSKIAVIPVEENNFKPTDEELLLAEQLVNKRLTIYNEEQKALNTDEKYLLPDSLYYEREIIELEKYHRQCEAFYNEKGEKIIIMNCLCDESIKNALSDWRKGKIIVNDGGSCFFKIAVNLDLKIVYGFMINGDA
jgi:hypothetical protein